MATPAAVREHYDSLAFIYRHFWGDHIHHGFFETGKESPEQAQEQLLEHCVALLHPNNRDLVLDVGCGHGATAVYLAKRFGCQVTGLTISEKQAGLARENVCRAGVSGLVEIEIGDVDRFAFPSEKLDLVWTMESSEHFLDKHRYFQNVGSALRGGGRLLLAAWTGSMKDRRVRGVADAFLCSELWTVDQYTSAIQGAGLQVRSCEDLTAKVIPTWEVCRQRARAASLVTPLLPSAARNFVAGIDLILEAYRSGELTYTVISAEKPSWMT
jgi:tocopherol O-methyltransferase